MRELALVPSLEDSVQGACHVWYGGGMIESLIRFLNRPAIIQRVHPSGRIRVVLWCEPTLWLLLHVADLLTTWALVGIHLAPGYREGDPGAAWALAHGGLAALAVQKTLIVGGGMLLALFGFRWLPCTMLALLAVVSAWVAAAVVSNSVLLTPR